MANLNKWIGIGRIGKMETRYTASGDPVTNFSLAVNDPYGKKEKGEDTDWFNCVAFKKTAEVLEKYAKVGQELYVEGKVKFRPWDKDGVKQYKAEVVVDNMQMLGGKDSNPVDSMSDAEVKSKFKKEIKKVVGSFNDFDDDVAF